MSTPFLASWRTSPRGSGTFGIVVLGRTPRDRRRCLAMATTRSGDPGCAHAHRGRDHRVDDVRSPSIVHPHHRVRRRHPLAGRNDGLDRCAVGGGSVHRRRRSPRHRRTGLGLWAPGDLRLGSIDAAGGSRVGAMGSQPEEPIAMADGDRHAGARRALLGASVAVSTVADPHLGVPGGWAAVDRVSGAAAAVGRSVAPRGDRPPSMVDSSNSDTAYSLAYGVIWQPPTRRPGCNGHGSALATVGAERRPILHGGPPHPAHRTRRQRHGHTRPTPMMDAGVPTVSPGGALDDQRMRPSRWSHKQCRGLGSLRRPGAVRSTRAPGSPHMAHRLVGGIRSAVGASGRRLATWRPRPDPSGLPRCSSSIVGGGGRQVHVIREPPPCASATSTAAW